MSNNKIKPIIFITALAMLFCLLFFYFWSKNASKLLFDNYSTNHSVIIYDRNDKIINIKKNIQGNYATYSDSIPARYKSLLLQKEDRFFYFHPGINPVSQMRSILNKIFTDKREGASTITQQLAKILLSHENDRSIKNKILEIFYSLALEMNTPKEKILMMYINSVYFGNNIQGIEEASRYYFDKSPEAMSDNEILELLATINSPSITPPNTVANREKVKFLAKKFEININESPLLTDNEINKQAEKFANFHYQPISFELNSLHYNCTAECRISVDSILTENIRQIAKRQLEKLMNKNTTNAAVVVFSEPQNELLAIVGSPDPTINAYGYQINMAIKKRPIGSTIKPFIYLRGFTEGLRPYSKVIDKEYKYIINDGFALYPKNYDYQYHGEVDLHYALSNSLNVPAVKVLEYVGEKNFNTFLQKDLHFKPLLDTDSYGLGIALGGLEMDLVSLTNYFSVFANNGELRPATLGPGIPLPREWASADFSWGKKISEPKYIQLINKILTDRLTGVEEFGLKSSLNVPAENYGVKTGTSREFHDSWTIGYTPDFVVGVWVGNSDNTAMDQVSGQLGAGKIWQETMNLLLNSTYNKKHKFNYSLIKEYNGLHGIEYGLAGDDYDKKLNLMAEKNLITKPHDNDIFLWKKENKIICQSEQKVVWIINNKKISESEELFFTPPSPGKYLIEASDGQTKESVTILVKEEE